MANFATYNSWGRTRGPKNIAGANGTAVTVLAHDAAVPSGTSATDGSSGYITENQRYLHVTIDVGSGNPGRDINIWVYQHSSGIWSVGGTIDCDAITINTTYVLEINGADRVAFQRSTGGWLNAPDAVYAACSTF
tara:strand:- start:27 stop:431 length:405 start_codon:yes stop_codon:yes gene_type:complete